MRLPPIPALPRRARAALVAIPLLLAGVAPVPAAPAPDEAPRTLTVVELYQSQGCSSCPPAIANVNALADRPDLLVLDFAVTYWDQLGWKDSFADPGFTRRQWDYAHGGGRAQVFTPQVIVNGRGVGVGGDARGLAALVRAQAPLNAGRIRSDGRQVEVAAARAGRAPAADVWLVRYDPRPLKVAIGRGENAGRTLVHRNIVRGLVRLGRWDGAETRFALPPAPPPLASAVIVQAANGGPILEAARIG